MMNPYLSFVLLALCIAQGASGYEANKRQRLAPSDQLKVNKAIAQSYQKGPNLADQSVRYGQQRVNQSCGSQRIGTVNTARAARIENITVVRGPVININRNVCQ